MAAFRLSGECDHGRRRSRANDGGAGGDGSRVDRGRRPGAAAHRRATCAGHRARRHPLHPAAAVLSGHHAPASAGGPRRRRAGGAGHAPAHEPRGAAAARGANGGELCRRLCRRQAAQPRLERPERADHHRHYPRRRDRRDQPRPDVPSGAGAHEPADPGLRPAAHLRAGVSARGAGLLGGHKYFFPGIAGQEVIDLTHWLGALITSYALIGTADTPVRAVMNRAAAFIPRQRAAICSVTVPEGVAGVFIGTPEDAFQSAAALSAERHIRWTDRTYARVLSVLPRMYDEIWVGSKGMYKTEPVVADGGEVILYAPHIHEISVVHGAVIREIGYHVLDFFTKQWDKYKRYPLGAVAHSTHVKGLGTYENGIECPRIQVTLATGIPADVCREVNLGYRDPASINPDDYANREDEGILLVPHAGETLYRPKASLLAL